MQSPRFFHFPAALIALVLCLGAARAPAEVQTREIRYTEGDTELVGLFAWDDAVEGKRPGVLVIHEWWGINAHPKNSARKLAELGYVAFALDMYGEGKFTSEYQQAAEWSGAFKGDADLAVRRIEAGLAQLRAHESTDGDALFAIGYCFGGSMVLTAARANLDLLGVVSFHGGLAPSPGQAEAESPIEPSVLVCNGAADSFVPAEEIQNFKDEMHRRAADWQLIEYGGALHSFTSTAADEDQIDGTAYDPAADRRSWAHMLGFFDDLMERP